MLDRLEPLNLNRVKRRTRPPVKTRPTPNPLRTTISRTNGAPALLPPHRRWRWNTPQTPAVDARDVETLRFHFISTVSNQQVGGDGAGDAASPAGEAVSAEQQVAPTQQGSASALSFLDPPSQGPEDGSHAATSSAPDNSDAAADVSDERQDGSREEDQAGQMSPGPL